MPAEGAPTPESTRLDQRLSSRQARTVVAPMLFVLMEGNRPLVGGARYALTGVIDVGRVFLAVEEVSVDADEGARDLDAADVSRERAGLLTLWPSLESRLCDLRRIASEDVTVTLVGETGTGKEVMAEALHHLSG